MREIRIRHVRQEDMQNFIKYQNHMKIIRINCKKRH